MKKLVLVSGPAGIGKSTYCVKYMNAHPDEKSFIVAADEVRKDLCGDYDKFPPNRDMSIVYNEMINRIHKLAEEHQELIVLVDTTMLFDERRLFFVENLPEFNYRELVLLKLHDYNIAIARNASRVGPKHVPDEVVIDMIKNYFDPTPETLIHFDNYREVFLDE